MTTADYISSLSSVFEKHQNPKDAVPMKKYMKNLFEYWGIKTQQRREISKPFIKKDSLPMYKDLEKIVKELYRKPQREFQYFAVELTGIYENDFEPGILPLLEFMITNKSWWDTVDGIAINLVGSLFEMYSKLIKPTTEQWIRSGNMWLQRSAILFQLKYKKETETKLLFDYILQLKDSKEFFIRKTIGWALREYSKTDAAAVIKFVNSAGITGLSRREALKHC